MGKKLLIISLSSLAGLLAVGGLVTFPLVINRSKGDDKQKAVYTEVFNNKFRIQILDEATVRIERIYGGNFLNDNTFFIPHRDEYEGVEEVKKTINGDYTYLNFADNLSLRVLTSAKYPSDITIVRGDQTIFSAPNEAINNSGDLPSPANTSETYKLFDKPRITIPDTGYSVESAALGGDFSGYTIQEDAYDLYVLIPEKDGKKLRELYVNAAGRSELARLSMLGAWDSRWYAYNEQTAQDEIDKYNYYDLPLDNLVLDTDWRNSTSTGGVGYDVNEDLFPDMERFLKQCHEQNIEVLFNDHPEPVMVNTQRANVLNPQEMTYRSTNLKNILEKGLDYWWYDRNWTVALVSPDSHIHHETWGTYLFNDVTERYFKEVAGNNSIYRRPLTMSNLDNVENGVWKGFNNSASHRYTFQWSGDIASDKNSLNQEVANVIKCGNNAYAYMSSDVGGHNRADPSDDLYCRWIQYGTLSPMFRIHCTQAATVTYRQPWYWSDNAMENFRLYSKLRYRLLPLYYALARENYETGLPICRSLEYNYPDDPLAQRYDEYLIGNNILFAPFAFDQNADWKTSWFPDGLSAKYYNNTSLSGTPVLERNEPGLNFAWSTGSPENGVVNADNFSASFQGRFVPDTDEELFITVDDGIRVYVDGSLVVNSWQGNDSVKFSIGSFDKGSEHTLKVEYYEGSGGAFLYGVYNDTAAVPNRDVYLPEGKWMNLFTGQIHEGNQTLNVTTEVKETGLFMRLGSVTPLVESVNNTKDIDWKNIAYDVYPGDDEDEGYLYEDDEETTAYKLGKYRKSPYSYEYDSSNKVSTISLKGGEGTFDGDDKTVNRNNKIKYHINNVVGEIDHVTVNGKTVNFNLINPTSGAFPLMYQDLNIDQVATFDVIATSREALEIKVYHK